MKFTINFKKTHKTLEETHDGNIHMNKKIFICCRNQT